MESKSKFLTIEVWANDRDIEDSKECVNDWFNWSECHEFLSDGTIELKVVENLFDNKGDK